MYELTIIFLIGAENVERKLGTKRQIHNQKKNLHEVLPIDFQRNLVNELRN